ncbi:hypothetical protein V8C35DRAFT_318012 [Trichoderma chlorosporum]
MGPKVRKVNFEGFKNRFSPDEEVHPVDVLVGGGDLIDDIRRELRIRRDFREIQARQRYSGSKRLSNSFLQWNYIQLPKANIQPREGAWFHRVRIQSKPILHHLGKVVGETWSLDTPRVFDRPFAALIYFQDKMKERLVELESKWSEEEHNQALVEAAREVKAEDNESNNGDSNTEEPGTEDRAYAITDSIEALRDIRCYVNFVDEEIMPLSKQYEGTTRKTVRFDDLWYLFSVGDLVWASEASTSAMSGKTATMYQPLWRIYTVNEPEDTWEYPTLESSSKPPKQDTDDANSETEFHKGKFIVWAYYIDHDGTDFGAVKHCFAIPPFTGERDITSLPCYPLRFLEGWVTQIESLKTQGRTFESCLKQNNHQSYTGWTIVSRPDGTLMPAEPSGSQRQLHSEYIDSHVIIDFAEAFHQFANWKPTIHRPTEYSADWVESNDSMAIITWSDEMRTKWLLKTQNESIQQANVVTMWQRRDGLMRDAFLRSTAKGLMNSEDVRSGG